LSVYLFVLETGERCGVQSIVPANAAIGTQKPPSVWFGTVRAARNAMF